jgi:hypothetical protein
MSLLTDLVAHWKLNEASGSRADSHGSFTLTDNNTVTSVAGTLGDAADFVGANLEYLSVAVTSTNLNVGTFDWTVALWAKSDFAGANDGVLIYWTNNESVRVGLNTIDGGDIIVERRISGDSTFHSTTLDAILTPNTWNFILFSYDATAGELRVRVNNGTQQTIAMASITSTANQFRIGRRISTGYYTGQIDSVSFWRRVLTTTEESDLYNSGSGLDYESFGGGGSAQDGTATAATYTLTCPDVTSSSGNVNAGVTSAVWTATSEPISASTEVTASVTAAPFSFTVANATSSTSVVCEVGPATFLIVVSPVEGLGSALTVSASSATWTFSVNNAAVGIVFENETAKPGALLVPAYDALRLSPDYDAVVLSPGDDILRIRA